MNKVRLYYFSLINLKLIQIFYQVYYRVKRPLRYDCNVHCAPDFSPRVSWPTVFTQSTTDGNRFTFLGKTELYNKNNVNPRLEKLWVYNWHYQNDLNAIGSENRYNLCAQLVEDWIKSNPSQYGVGWDPYCLSLRIVNWIKWFNRLHESQLDKAWVKSLCLQVQVLDKRLEYHILGNHIFANSKALIFAGCFMNGDAGLSWLEKGVKLLDHEISEQFLSDGAHFELSPMYHAILLWDLADLICLQQSTDCLLLEQRVEKLKRCFYLGLLWLHNMVHPDQDLSFFNDATLGVAPTLHELEDYAKDLGLEVPEITKAKELRGRLQEPSGYGVFDWPEKHRLIADVARVGPDYQPGHAHADTLSCELSLFGQRVLVNSGISKYGDDSERLRQRSTAAHNTVEVDGENSSEVWAGFRVARRAKPIGVELKHGEGHVVLTAYHDGYRRLPGKVIHHRRWLAEPSSLVITDEVFGRYCSAVAYWHLHPDVVLERLNDTCFELTLPQGQVARLNITRADVEVCEGTWHPGFGQSLTNTLLLLKLSTQTLKTQIEWSSE